MTIPAVALAMMLIEGAVGGHFQPAAQQQAPWEPWLGCWTLQPDRAIQEIDPAGIAAVPGGSSMPLSGVRVCVKPAEPGPGVVLTTMVADQSMLTQTIVADGIERPIDEQGCWGQVQSRWSQSGRRLFTRADLTCQSAAPRSISQLSMLTKGGTWLDVQSVTTGGRESVRVRRYQRASGETPSAGRAGTAAALTLAEVKEASTTLSPRVIEAAMMETKAGFDLDGKTLIALDDAGVPDSVIDVMVALSYPDRFVVDRSSGSVGSVSGGSGFGYPDHWSFGDPLLWGYYAPYAYNYWGYGNPWTSPGYGWIPVEPGGAGGSVEPQPSGSGRVVDGHGYTRIRPREAIPSSGGAEPRGSSGASSPASSGASDGGVSGQGYSGGGGDTGRTAQPRPPGGGK